MAIKDVAKLILAEIDDPPTFAVAARVHSTWAQAARELVKVKRYQFVGPIELTAVDTHNTRWCMSARQMRWDRNTFHGPFKLKGVPCAYSPERRFVSCPVTITGHYYDGHIHGPCTLEWHYSPIFLDDIVRVEMEYNKGVFSKLVSAYDKSNQLVIGVTYKAEAICITNGMLYYPLPAVICCAKCRNDHLREVPSEALCVYCEN